MTLPNILRACFAAFLIVVFGLGRVFQAIGDFIVSISDWGFKVLHRRYAKAVEKRRRVLLKPRWKRP